MRNRLSSTWGTFKAEVEQPPSLNIQIKDIEILCCASWRTCVSGKINSRLFGLSPRLIIYKFVHSPSA